MTDQIVTAFAPATVSNVACGFDVLGFALEAPGDEVSACFTSPRMSRADLASLVTIEAITGPGGEDGRLPREARRNTAGVAAQALLTALGERRGIALRIAKGLPLASGLGGSAASAAAAVVAVDALLEAHAPLEMLIACAIEGEGLGVRSAHPDNIAPALCGGFVLVRHPDPPDIVRLPVPAELMAVVVHPDLEIETAKARALIGTTVPLADAIRQWANLGALVDGLHRADFALISRALEDTIAEPRRASLVPGLAHIKRAAVDAGALGCSLSGSGPSLFALCRGADSARRVADAMTHAVKTHIGGEPQTYVSAIARQGARVVSPCVS
jgi:homoserine kinase